MPRDSRGKMAKLNSFELQVSAKFERSPQILNKGPVEQCGYGGKPRIPMEASNRGEALVGLSPRDLDPERPHWVAAARAREGGGTSAQWMCATPRCSP